MKIVHASPGFISQLTEQQVTDFLSISKLNLQLGTIDKNGEPNMGSVPESQRNHFNLESKAENKNGRIVVASA